MNVSVVITTKNAEEDLKRLLDSLDKFSKSIEVIVVDSRSTDDTPKIAKSRPYVKFISEECTAGGGRNIGVKNAKYDIIAMLDADTEVTDEWFPELVSTMKYSDIAAGYAPDPNGKHLSRVPIVINGQDITYPQCNIAYKKHVFDDVGFLRDDMTYAEDCEFNYRCTKKGYKITYNPKMVAFHYERPTKKQWISKAIKNGYGRFELEKFIPEIKNKHEHGFKMNNLIRLGFGFIGYVMGHLKGNKKDEEGVKGPGIR